MSSYVKYFAHTFECRIVNSFLSDSQFSRQGLVLYLQCRRLAKTMTKLRSADEFYLTKKELTKFVARLKNDDSQGLKETILEWVQQEFQFLREIDVYKMDTSGLTGYLLKFFRGNGEISFSYLLEFLLKDFFLENNRRVIIDICSKLKIGNIGTFVTNLSKYNSAHENWFSTASNPFTDTLGPRGSGSGENDRKTESRSDNFLERIETLQKEELERSQKDKQ
jgi:hypothetical protein